jgi:hypothetical protein
MARRRLDDLIELREALRPQVLDVHSEHGLQGVSGLVGQYVRILAEIEELSAKETPDDGIDEIASRRTARRAGPAKRPGRARKSG